MPRPFFRQIRLDGCAFVVITCVVTCVLLIVNVAIVTALVNQFMPAVGRFSAERSKYAQTIRFIGPVLLIFAEWTLIEYALRWISQKWRRKT